MTNAVDLMNKPGPSQSGAVNDVKAIFLDWPLEGSPFAEGGLFSSPSLSEYDLVFVDPLRALRSVGAWSGGGEISEQQYVKWGEKELALYLSKVKTARAALDDLLVRGGSLILRANLPKANIRVVKKSSGSARSYTESVVSALFWLEEMIGRYSIRYVSNRVIKYASELHPLAQSLGPAQIKALQAIDSVSNGRLEHVAFTGASFRTPAISRILPGNYKGEVWLVPEFEIKNEPGRLVEAFRAVVGYSQVSARQPQWVQAYQEQLDRQNPFRRQLDDIAAQIDALKKQRQVAREREREVSLLTQLLWERGPALSATVAIALGLIGWKAIDSPIASDECLLDMRLPAGGPKARAVIHIADSQNGPIVADAVESLAQTMEEGKLKDRAKGIVVGNAQPKVKPNAREEWFDQEAIRAAQRHDFCLLPTSELLLIAGFMLEKHEAPNRNTLEAALAKDLTICDAEFKLNSKRYGM